MIELCSCGKNPLGLYEVKAGDTAQTVSAAYGIPVGSIVAANGLQTFPPPGSLLLLPPSDGKVYIVVAGDTVASICSKFHLSPEEFCRRNGCAYVYPTQQVFLD